MKFKNSDDHKDSEKVVNDQWTTNNQLKQGMNGWTKECEKESLKIMINT